MKKYLVLILILLVSLIIPVTSIHAEKTIGQLENELNSKQAKLDANKQKASENSANIASTKSEINDIYAKMNDIQNQIDNKTKESTELEEKIKKKNQEIKDLMRYYQVSSSGSALLEYVMGAQSLTDLIYRLSITEQVTNYNKKTINEMNDMIAQNERIKKELASKRDEMQVLQADLGKKLASLNDEQANLGSEAKTLSQEIKDMQNIIKNLKAQGCNSSETQTKCYARLYPKKSSGRGSSAGPVDVPPGYNWYRPLVKSKINSLPGYRSSFGRYHMGTDYTGDGGTPVYPVADGTVGYIKYGGDSCGNQVFIWSVVNGSKYTSWYCHLSAINVSVGQGVGKNTVVGAVGRTGHEYYSNYNMPNHLHVAVGTGWYYRDYYTSFSSHVKTLSTDLAPGLFPAVGVWWNGR